LYSLFFLSMKNILIIGYGKLGSSLFTALQEQQKYHLMVHDKDGSVPDGPATIRTDIYRTEINQSIISLTDMIIISVPDDNIDDVVKSLGKFDLKQTIVIHTSGVHSSNQLVDLQKQGAYTGSLHPVQTFPERLGPAALWQNIKLTYEGSEEGFKICNEICSQFKSELLQVTANQKQALHIAAVFAANYAVALYASAENILTKQKLSKDMLLPLMKQVQSNFEKHPAHEILSGPLQRSDHQTIAKHLEFLDLHEFTNEKELYRQMARFILDDDNFKIIQRDKLKKVIDKNGS